MMKLPCEHIKIHILLVIILFTYSACSLSDSHDNDEEIEKISQEIRDGIEGELVYETEYSKVYKCKLGEISIKLSDHSLCVPRWSNDGSNIAFLEYQRTENGGETRLIITDQNGVEVKNWLIFSQSSMPSWCISWSPDDKTIAILKSYNRVVYIVIDIGEIEEYVISDKAYAHFNSLAWCPKNNKIAISQSKKIWMINPFENNPEMELLSECDDYVYHLDWNHKGTKLTYSDEFVGSIYIINSDGTGNQKIETSGIFKRRRVRGVAPCWAANDEQIFYYGVKGEDWGNWEYVLSLFVTDIQGSYNVDLNIKGGKPDCK